VSTIRTRDGAELTIRPIAAADRGALHRHFLSLSAETRQRRFLHPVKELTERDLTYLTEVDHHDHEALIAVDEDGEIVGVARFIRLEDRLDAAEVAVTIRDSWQGRGVGTAVLAALMTRAREEGIDSFSALCLAANRDMMILFEELGESVRRTGSAHGAIELEIVLPTEEREAIGPALRAAARAPDLAAREPLAGS
jgi:RimJ/RimL family protein N-acetyltransferase